MTRSRRHGDAELTAQLRAVGAWGGLCAQPVVSHPVGPTSAALLRRSGRKGRQRSVVWQGEGSIPEDADTAPSSSLPSTEDVIRKTEQITKNIQELLRAAQENKHDR